MSQQNPLAGQARPGLRAGGIQALRHVRDGRSRGAREGGMTMALDVRDVRTRRDLRAFIRLPSKIHRDHRRWVPPLLSEERTYFSPSKNRAFAFSDAVLALASRDGIPCGRIMGIVNHRYNQARGERNARFAFLECGEYDEETARALLAHVEAWARALGMTKIIGPIGFSDQDPQGFLIEGFNEEPTIGSYCNF